MTPNIRIALRFFTANKRAMTMSLAGIVFGVGFFIFSQAQTSGFEQFFIKTILGTNGAVRIQDRIQHTMRSVEVGDSEGNDWTYQNNENLRYVSGIETPQSVIEGIRQFKDVTGVSEVLEGSVMVSSSVRSEGGKLYGINVDDHIAVSDIENQIIFGSIQKFKETPNGILLGSRLAQRLQVRVDDTVLLQARDQNRRYEVAGIYETGVSDIDRVRVFMHLSEARSILQIPQAASFIQVSLADPMRAPEIAQQMTPTLMHMVSSWQEREKTWLDAFLVLRVSSGLTVSTIILLSGLGMFNTLAMLVMEKTKEIAILRSMGYTRKDISRIFLWQGCFVLIIGTILGWIFAALITYGVSKLPFRVTGIFTTDSFVVHWSIWHYIAATVTASVVVLIASYIPARRAARLEPGDVIRGTSQ